MPKKLLLAGLVVLVVACGSARNWAGTYHGSSQPIGGWDLSADPLCILPAPAGAIAMPIDLPTVVPTTIVVTDAVGNMNGGKHTVETMFQLPDGSSGGCTTTTGMDDSGGSMTWRPSSCQINGPTGTQLVAMTGVTGNMYIADGFSPSVPSWQIIGSLGSPTGQCLTLSGGAQQP